MRLRSVWISRLVIIAASLILTLGLLEVVARILHFGSGGFWEPHPLYGWRNVPNAVGWESCYGECAVKVRINSLGLRDEEVTYAKPDGTSRVLLLGDSMTAGMQVELADTFGERLEQALLEGDGMWEVVNAAVNGFGTDNTLIYFDLEGRKFEPDIVLLGVYLANDVYNNDYLLEVRYSGSGHKPHYTLSDDGELVLHNFPVESADGLTVRMGSFLKRYFQLPRFFAQVLKLRGQVPEILRPILRPFTGERGAREQDTPSAPITQGDICDQEYSPEVEQAWKITKALLLELKRQVETSGAELIVLVIPASPQVIPPQDGRDWYCDQANEELAGFLRDEGFVWLDLLHTFREHMLEGGPSLYYTRDFHMNAAGHALAGERLREFFQSEVLISAERP